MKCSLCEVQCIIPDGTVLYTSSKNFAVVNQAGAVMCMACSEVSDWACSNISVCKTDSKSNKTKKEDLINQQTSPTNPASPISSPNSIYCSKCKDRFSTRLCKCGNKNPLFRK